MRLMRKEDEQIAIDVLKEHLVQIGHQVSEAQSIVDDPDAALEVDGAVVACECRHFTPERILELHGLKLTDGELYQLFIPMEPHIWVRDAILAKAPYISRYKANAGASEAWLILHPSTDSALGDFMPKAIGPYGELYSLGAWQTEHGFEKIFVTGRDAQDVACILDKRQEQTEGRTFRASDVDRIPVRFAFIYPTRLEKGPDGRSMITTPPLSRADHQWKFQPLDERFCVDYSQVDTLSYANIGRGAEPPALYATRKLL